MDWRILLRSFHNQISTTWNTLWRRRAILWRSLPLQYVIHRWQRLSPSTRALPAHFGMAIVNFKGRGTRQAAALSYYGVFSVFPLTLLVAVAISALLGPAVAEEQISQALILFLPEKTETIKLFQDSLEQAFRQSRSFGLIALIGLTWSALGLFSNLTSSLDLIFQAHASRSMWRQRILAFLMTLVLILLVILSFIASGMLHLVDAILLTNPSIWITIGRYFLPLGLNLVIFVLVFRYVPARYVHWDAIWPAGILGAIGLEAAKTAFTWYLSNLADFQFVYGSIATVIVLLLWAYFSSCIFLICAEICAQLNLWLINRTRAPRIGIFPESAIPQLPIEIPPPV